MANGMLPLLPDFFCNFISFSLIEFVTRKNSSRSSFGAGEARYAECK